TGSGTNLLVSAIIQSDTSRRRLPPQTIELLRKIQVHNERERRGVVTMEECDPSSPCQAPPDALQAPEN
ncbi:MAG: hypothetical protein AAFX85_15445, partial [Pseudomonadota bacterium]